MNRPESPGGADPARETESHVSTEDRATLRNWVEDAEHAEGTRTPAARVGERDSEEVRALRKRVAELERANEILKTSAVFSPRRSSTADSSDRRLPLKWIESHRDRFGVEPICRVLSEHGLKIAPSTYYDRHRSPVTIAELEEAYLVNALVALHRENWGVYGVRKLWHAARRAGLVELVANHARAVATGRRVEPPPRSGLRVADDRDWCSL